MQEGVGFGVCVAGGEAGAECGGAEAVGAPPAGAEAPEPAGERLTVAEAVAEGDCDFLALSETLGDAEALVLADAEVSEAGAFGSPEVSPPGEEVALGEAPSVRVWSAAAEFAPVT
ncbi:hypothetical protein OG539_15865 [Actinacidiphila glaucinigra]|uniref:hypothetical protein n=1 Tax=Actinacidiphila glaucinigra TaxID=235986 RepID=UPI002DDC2106|nr:hypothetical protein [Actinacidiphila glaucinigra]WSD62246.1 hypothetical protein OIE69_26870 [Actinacidiphila glaucinigra]